MPYIKDNDGGQLLNANQFYYTEDELGRPILNVRGGGGGGGAVDSVNGKTGDVILTADDIPAGANSQQFTNADKAQLTQNTTNINTIRTNLNNKLDKSGGTMTGDINMNSHNLNNVEKIGIDGNNPMFIGSVIEAASTAPRITPTNDGKVAFVEANSQNTYIPISVGAPTSANDAATKQYVDNALAAAGNLPPATAADADKVLTVNAQGVAEWTNREDLFLITGYIGQTASVNKTYAQIKAAIDANKPTLLYAASTYYQLSYRNITDDEIWYGRMSENFFSYFSIKRNGLTTFNEVRILQNKLTDKGKPVVVGEDLELHSADFAMIDTPTAADAGKAPVVQNDGSIKWTTVGGGGTTGAVVPVPKQTETERWQVLTINDSNDGVKWADGCYTITINKSSKDFTDRNAIHFTCDKDFMEVRLKVLSNLPSRAMYAQETGTNPTYEIYSPLGYGKSGANDCVRFFRVEGSYLYVLEMFLDQDANMLYRRRFMTNNFTDADKGKMVIVTDGGSIDVADNPITPIPATADTGKVLVAKADGTVEWSDAGGGTIPTPTAADKGKVLIVNNANIPEWNDNIDCGTIA